jgi:hypothetical protein
VGVDGPDSYADKLNPIRYPRQKSDETYLDLNGYRTRHFPYNLYLNRLMQECVPGWVLILDDDDEFFNSNSLLDIMAPMKRPLDAAFWRVRVGNKMVPSNINFRNRPVCKDFSMIGMAFHTSYIPLLQFDNYKQADYRVADRIFSILNVVWIDKVLTQTQSRENAAGAGRRKDKNEAIKIDPAVLARQKRNLFRQDKK